MSRIIIKTESEDYYEGPFYTYMKQRYIAYVAKSDHKRNVLDSIFNRKTIFLCNSINI